MSPKPRPPRRPAAPRPPQAPSAPAPPPAALYASTSRGLESLLAEELTQSLGARAVKTERGRLTFEVTSLPATPLRLLACDRVGLAVRESEGDFVGPGGLAEIRGKLARTEFDRTLELLPRFGLGSPTHVRVVAGAAPGCDYMFFDVKREATAIVARRLGLEPSEDPAALAVEVQASPQALRVGVLLPLDSWGLPGRSQRSLVGAVVRLAGPAPQLTVCDPDCGGGEVLRVWQQVTAGVRVLALSWRRSKEVGPPGRAVVADPRSWPVADARLSRVASLNPRLTTPAEFARLLDETVRCLAPGGRAVFLTPAEEPFTRALDAQPRLTVESSLFLREREASRRVICLRREPDPEGHRTPVTAGDRARASHRLGGVAGRQRRVPKRRQPVRRDKPKDPGTQSS